MVPADEQAADSNVANTIEGGQYTPGWYPAVGQLWIGGRGACTATLVADWVVLTAKHCGGATHFGVSDQNGAKAWVPVYQYMESPSADLMLYSLRQRTGVVAMGRGTATGGAAATMIGFGTHTEGGDVYTEYKFAAKAKVVRVGGIITAEGTDGRVAPGDSGGPLIVAGRTVGTLITAESTGSYRALYTSHAANRDWLESNIAWMNHAP